MVDNPNFSSNKFNFLEISDQKVRFVYNESKEYQICEVTSDSFQVTYTNFDREKANKLPDHLRRQILRKK